MGQLIKTRALTALLVNLSRLLLAAVLLVSGFVKAVDPLGLSYKLQEYFAAFGLDSISDGWFQLAAVLLSAGEFVMGMLLLAGVYKRVSTLLVFLFFLFFTPLTLVLAIWNPVRDCGCFGDAIKLSNWATFGKNVFLLVFATLVCFRHRLFVRRVSQRNRWMIALFSVCYIISVEAVSLSFLPIMDFRPFAVGSDLRAAVEDIPSEYEVIYRFEKDGTVKEFDEENYPDSTWNYLGSRSEVLKAGRPAIVPDFAFLDMDTGEDYATEILSDSNYVCLLVINRIETADESRVDKINDMYYFCMEQGVKFYAATSSDVDAVELWRKRTGAEYPVFWADEVMLKTILRSNPGLLLVKDGMVVGKWNVTDLPSVDEIYGSPTMMPDKVHGVYDYTRDMKVWLLLFAVPLALIIIIDMFTGRPKKSVAVGVESPDSNEETDNDKTENNIDLLEQTIKNKEK